MVAFKLEELEVGHCRKCQRPLPEDRAFLCYVCSPDLMDSKPGCYVHVWEWQEATHEYQGALMKRLSDEELAKLKKAGALSHCMKYPAREEK